MCIDKVQSKFLYSFKIAWHSETAAYLLSVDAVRGLHTKQCQWHSPVLCLRLCEIPQ